MRWMVKSEWWVVRRLARLSPPFTIHYSLLTLLLIGCGSPDRLVPLTVGKHWDYRFRWGVQREMGRVEVVRETPLGSGKGWELRGPMGVSRLGYEGANLVADQLGGAFLTPPLPIGIPVKTKEVWSGWVTSPEGRKPAKAIVSAASAKLKVGGRTRTLNRTVVTMRVGGHAIELATWYAPGDGIVQQEQRTDENLDLALERVAGGG